MKSQKVKETNKKAKLKLCPDSNSFRDLSEDIQCSKRDTEFSETNSTLSSSADSSTSDTNKKPLPIIPVVSLIVQPNKTIPGISPREAQFKANFLIRKPNLNLGNMSNSLSENDSNKYNSSQTSTKLSSNQFLKKFENTVILNLKLQISKNSFATIEIRKYDNVFTILENFLKKHNINKKDLLHSLAIKVFAGLATISNVYNRNTQSLDQAYLRSLYQEWKIHYRK